MKKYENMNDFNGEEEKPQKRKRMTLNPFENLYRKDGKGVEKGEELNVLDKPGLVNFFKLLRRKLNYIFSVNILAVVGNFPLLFALFALAYTTESASSPSYQVYAALKGSAMFDASPVVTSLLGAFGGQATVTVPTAATYVLIACLLWFCSRSDLSMWEILIFSEMLSAANRCLSGTISGMP